MTKNKTGKVIPFTQGATFYMKRGAKELEKNDLIAAIGKYREAYERAPEDAEIAIALAEILSQMQRFEESNRILFRLLADQEDAPAECHFGLACNYFGLQDYDRAADSLEDYLELEPDGEFAADAEDFLDLIDDDDAMFETTGLRGDDDYEDNAVNHFARSLLASGEATYAVEELEHRLSQTPQSLKIREQLAIAYFVANRRDEAKEIADGILDNVVRRERNVDVERLYIQHTDKASKNILIDIPRTSLDHIFAFIPSSSAMKHYTVMTQANRESLLGKPPDDGILDRGIKYLTDANTLIGAQINHLAHAHDNIVTQQENVTAAESTIRDTDMASEMTNYAKENILAQAAQTMLAQAHSSSQDVLKLLQ